ncbi:MAG: TRAP transporter small permease [Tropicimonas sp.]|uniref:TRAP transporter small permease n=1 Tax=Tropicimonas sp. TaxID=2067044 RepID=UPI003A883B8A
MNLPREAALHASAGRILERICHVLAMIGGAFMVCAMLTLVVHVAGNALDMPILGADEIVELLIGASIFCFLAPCHLRGANIVVDYFSRPLPRWARNAADVCVTLLFALIAALLTWRLMAGGMSAFTRNKQSMFLSLPEWPTYLMGSIACVIWVIAILYTTWTALRVATGRQEAPHG